MLLGKCLLQMSPPVLPVGPDLDFDTIKGAVSKVEKHLSNTLFTLNKYALLQNPLLFYFEKPENSSCSSAVKERQSYELVVAGSTPVKRNL